MAYGGGGLSALEQVIIGVEFAHRPRRVGQRGGAWRQRLGCGNRRCQIARFIAQLDAHSVGVGADVGDRARAVVFGRNGAGNGDEVAGIQAVAGRGHRGAVGRAADVGPGDGGNVLAGIDGAARQGGGETGGVDDGNRVFPVVAGGHFVLDDHGVARGQSVRGSGGDGQRRRRPGVVCHRRNAGGGMGLDPEFGQHGGDAIFRITWRRE